MKIRICSLNSFDLYGPVIVGGRIFFARSGNLLWDVNLVSFCGHNGKNVIIYLTFWHSFLHMNSYKLFYM